MGWKGADPLLSFPTTTAWRIWKTALPPCGVDNGSTDGSRELVQEKFPKVRLISLDRNYGFCRAVNRGMEASETTYVILLNNDTEAQPGFVKALEKAMDGDERVFSGAARMVRMDAPSRIDDAGDYYCA